MASEVGECCSSKGDIKIPHIRMKKACWGNIGNLFVTCMQLLGVSDYFLMYRQRAKFCETSAKVTNWVTDPFRWLCEFL